MSDNLFKLMVRWNLKHLTPLLHETMHEISRLHLESGHWEKQIQKRNEEVARHRQTLYEQHLHIALWPMVNGPLAHEQRKHDHQEGALTAAQANTMAVARQVLKEFLFLPHVQKEWSDLMARKSFHEAYYTLGEQRMKENYLHSRNGLGVTLDFEKPKQKGP